MQKCFAKKNFYNTFIRYDVVLPSIYSRHFTYNLQPLEIKFIRSTSEAFLIVVKLQQQQQQQALFARP